MYDSMHITLLGHIPDCLGHIMSLRYLGVSGNRKMTGSVIVYCCLAHGHSTINSLRNLYVVSVAVSFHFTSEHPISIFFIFSSNSHLFVIYTGPIPLSVETLIDSGGLKLVSDGLAGIYIPPFSTYT